MSGHVYHYLICYDICDPKRLGRVGRVSRQQALALQYSVYYLLGTAADLERFLVRLDALIDEDVDDIRAYRIPDLGRVERQGESWLPDGIFG
jgi:CRISPR-associated protein Cas2